MKAGGKGYEIVQAETLRAWMEKGLDYVLIDTLPKEVFDTQHLPGASNACVYEVTFPERVSGITPQTGRKIVLYGSSAASRDALEAAEKLVRLGYREVYALEGGVEAWVRAGYPLLGRKVEPPERIGAIQLEDGLYPVDVAQSVIGWTGRNAAKKHHGTVNLSQGEIRVKSGAVDGRFVIDMRSVKNLDLEGDPLQPVLLAHLLSDDFFFVRLFPKAVFTLTAARPLPSPALSTPNFEVEGTLELRGVKADVVFPATVNRRDDGAVCIEAHFDMDRTRWNVLYGSSRFFEHLGMHMVYDPVTLELRIVTGRVT